MISPEQFGVLILLRYNKNVHFWGVISNQYNCFAWEEVILEILFGYWDSLCCFSLCNVVLFFHAWHVSSICFLVVAFGSRRKAFMSSPAVCECGYHLIQAWLTGHNVNKCWVCLAISLHVTLNVQSWKLAYGTSASWVMRSLTLYSRNKLFRMVYYFFFTMTYYIFQNISTLPLFYPAGKAGFLVWWTGINVVQC